MFLLLSIPLIFAISPPPTVVCESTGRTKLLQIPLETSLKSTEHQASADYETLLQLRVNGIPSHVAAVELPEVVKEDDVSENDLHKKDSCKLRESSPVILFHVGPHKTGSTSFQQFLLDRRELLLQHGFHIYFEKNMSTGVKGAADFARSLQRKDLLDPSRASKLNQSQILESWTDFLHAVKEAMIRGDNVRGIIVSSEEFDEVGFTDKEVMAHGRQVHEHDSDFGWSFVRRSLEYVFDVPNVVVYLKNRQVAPDWLYSLGDQMTKDTPQNFTGGVGNFRQWLMEHDWACQRSPYAVSMRVQSQFLGTLHCNGSLVVIPSHASMQQVFCDSLFRSGFPGEGHVALQNENYHTCISHEEFLNVRQSNYTNADVEYVKEWILDKPDCRELL